MNKLILLFAMFFLIYSCQESDSKGLVLLVPKSMKFLGHKGSGPLDASGNSSLIENTWKSIFNAVETLDGSEIDLQMSADSTLWIFHDHELLDCNNQRVNIANCSDEKIDSISNCLFKSELLTFDEFIKRSNLEKWKNKTISLDLKLLYNPSLISRFESNESLTLYSIEKLKEKLIELPYAVLFEVPTVEQYNLFNEHFKNRVYLVNHQPSDFFLDSEKKSGTNLSIPYRELSVENNYFENQKVQLWTINSPNDFFGSVKLNPNYIQSDNIPLMHFFKQIQKGDTVYNIHSEKHNIGNEVSEFYPLVKKELPQNNVLVEINSSGKNFPDEFLLTFSAFDSNDSAVHWEGYEMNKFDHPSFFINPTYLSNKNADKFAISIWNKSQSEYSGEFQLEFFSLVKD